jgi:predicted O-linked N-acetylglucosamine transferase (SPINDLY family)
MGNTEDALAHFKRALEIRPGFIEALSNLGNLLMKIGQLENATEFYQRAVEANPNSADTHCNLGNVLLGLGKLDDALVRYRRALEIKPDFAAALSNLAQTLHGLGQREDALTCLQRAQQIDPDLVEAHAGMASLLKDLGKLREAAASARRAIELKPNFVEGYCILATILFDLGEIDEAVASYRRGSQIDPDFIDARSSILFMLNFLPSESASSSFAEAQRYGELVARKARRYTAWLGSPDANRCLRVGFVSGDFRKHPVGFFLENVLTALAAIAPGRLQLIAYSNHFVADAVSAHLQSCCHLWRSVYGLSDESAARLIHEDGVDILIDLSGHTSHNRLPLFAWKPAPVLVSWLGYFATTGVAAIDYLIADPWVLPKAEEAYFTERIWRLPETRLCFTPPAVDIDVSPLPALANGYVTFGCFNNLAKMNDQVVAVWALILKAIPHSRLLLKAAQLNEKSVQQDTFQRFAAYDIDARRLILEGADSREKYLTAYHRIDIALDPFPYPGGTTTAEGLWMGVPVVTLAGQNFLSRQGVGMLMNAGLPDWVAYNADDYVKRASAHAADIASLASLRNRLRQQVLASPLFDAARFARHFDTALREMWVAWCNRQPVLE